MEKLKVGIVGIGGFGGMHLKGIEYCDEQGLMELQAATIRSKGKYEKQEKELIAKGVRIYRDYAEMLDKEQGVLDLIALPTGIDSHEEQSIMALEAGYHVLCEKPVAGSIEECKLMADATERTGKVLCIGYQHIFSNSIQKIKKLTVNQDLGKLLSAKTKIMWPRNSNYYTRNSWVGRVKLGEKLVFDSPMMNACAHYLNNLLYIAGPALTESATPATVYAENYKVNDIEFADTQFLRVETAKGVKIAFMATHACPIERNPIAEFIYENGRIVWTFDDNGKTEVFKNAPDGEELIDTFHNEDVEMHYLVFVNIAEHLLKGKTLLCDVNNSTAQVICVNPTSALKKIQ